MNAWHHVFPPVYIYIRETPTREKFNIVYFFPIFEVPSYVHVKLHWSSSPFHFLSLIAYSRPISSFITFIYATITSGRLRVFFGCSIANTCCLKNVFDFLASKAVALRQSLLISTLINRKDTEILAYNVNEIMLFN